MPNLNTLPRTITSYDLIKTFAVLFMVADHVGYYFFPEDTWWRVFGRFCVPVWFFLIGYARSRDIGPKLWIGSALLFAGNLVTGMGLIPLSILPTMIAIRLVIDPMMERMLRGAHEFWAVSVILVFLIFPSGMLAEYGTQGLLLAMFGWLVRNRDRIPEDMPKLLNHYFAFAFITFIIFQKISFMPTPPQFLVLRLGIMAVMGTLYFFRPLEFPRLTKALGPVAGLVRFTGRRTLEIYVAHLLLFKALGLHFQPERFALFDWVLFSWSGT